MLYYWDIDEGIRRVQSDLQPIKSNGNDAKRNRAAILVNEVKALMMSETDDGKKKRLAEIGLAMNRFYMQL